MRKKLKRILLLSTVIILGGLLLAYIWFSSQFQIQPIAQNVYLISSPIGANVTVVDGNDGILLVDSQLSVVSFFLKRAIRKISDKPVKYIINTHWHPDHNGGNGKIGSGAVIIGHENLKKRMSMAQKGYGLTKPGSYHEFKPRAQSDLPNRTFHDTLRFEFSGQKVLVFHSPNAHTDSDAVVHLVDSNVVCLGDLIFKDEFPYIDVYNKGSVKGLERALAAIIDQTNSGTKFISGHSYICSRADLIRTRNMIKKSIEIVGEHKSAGRTLSDIIELNYSQEFAHWSGELVPLEVWLKMVFESL